jgi:hypothetical protein
MQKAIVTVVNIYCRVCGEELKVMAVCIKCGREVLYGCPRCAIFSDTRIHVDCLNVISSIAHDKDA